MKKAIIFQFDMQSVHDLKTNGDILVGRCHWRDNVAVHIQFMDEQDAINRFPSAIEVYLSSKGIQHSVLEVENRKWCYVAIPAD